MKYPREWDTIGYTDSGEIPELPPRSAALQEMHNILDCPGELNIHDTRRALKAFLDWADEEERRNMRR